MSTTDPTMPGTADESEAVVVESAQEAVETDAGGAESAAYSAPEPLIEPEPVTPVAADAVADSGSTLGATAVTDVADDDVIVAEVVEEPTGAMPVATPAPAAPPVPPAAAEAPRVVYVQPVAEPKKLHNRGIGSLLALLGTVVFAALLVGATWLLGYVTEGSTGIGFLGEAKFWLPVGVFAVAFILLVLLANRASWWAYILGSILVAAGVYFGTIGLALAFDTILREPAPSTFGSAMVSPFVIIAALLAREVSMWFGSIIARRGRKLKVRNAEARVAYEREAAERRAATGY